MIKYKNPILLGMILFISIVAYSVIMFILIEIHTTQFWIAYTFTMVAFLLQIPALLLSFGKQQSLRKIFFGLHIDAISSIYLGIQIVLGLIVAFVPSFSIKIASVLSIILLAGYVILLISAYIAKEVIKKVDERVAHKTSFIKLMVTEVELMKNKTNDPILRKKLKELVETIRYSDPMSHEPLSNIEGRIELVTAELIELIIHGNNEAAKAKIDEIENLFFERNKKSKLLK